MFLLTCNSSVDERPQTACNHFYNPRVVIMLAADKNVAFKFLSFIELICSSKSKTNHQHNHLSFYHRQNQSPARELFGEFV